MGATSPEIINDSIQSISPLVMPIYGNTGMFNYPILTRLRPPRYDLFNRIVLADDENKWRLMYSFALDYIRGAAGTIFARQGLMLALPSNILVDPSADTFCIIPSTPADIPVSDVHYVIPILYDDNFMSNFEAANPTYMEYINTYSPDYVMSTLVNTTDAIIIPVTSL